MKRIAVYTLGCKANQYQSFALKCRMMDPECRMVEFDQLADIYVVNTCTVTEDADRKSRQAIRRALRQNPKARVIVTGCYAKLKKEELLELFPQIEVLEPSSLIPHPLSLIPRIRAHLMIQDGCEHFCSYCIVPHARGKIKSKPADDVIAEAEQLILAGAREIILTGINLGTYQYDLPEIISRLSMLEGLLRVRLSSLEPMYLNKDLIDAAANNPKVCKHLHVPLQSGDNNILKAMRRNYTREDYLELIHYIRGKMPGCGITTDIIVGFPGEGEKEFHNTIDLVEQIKFSRTHIFPYSKRKGTPAADFSDQVDIIEKKRRSKILQELRLKLMREFATQYLNKEVEILAEQKGEGLTSNYIRCFFHDPADSSGQLKKILACSINDSGEIRG